jgi:cystathionine beta-lyase/cystathionine gamma-synthase
VFRSSTYVFDTPEAAERAFSTASGRIPAEEGQRADLIYSRISHPNAEILEDQIVPLEAGAHAAAVFNSGMAAIMTAFFTVSRLTGTIVYTTPLYGGTTGLIHQFLGPLHMKGVPVASGDTDGLDRAIAAARDCCMVYLETPANPTLTMTDIERASAAAARHPDRPLVIVDNTFLGPVFQNPLPLGADLVVYSATKYLAGFSDMLAGVALARDPQIIQTLRSRRMMFGNILQPD